ncbi:MAG TPA: YggS family pyridoxal phosphate enzyme [Acidimicrobiales bacterium]|nr:YggS family pyridoxal phosphate enzyme [Acidimicrobiales bacterium]
MTIDAALVARNIADVRAAISERTDRRVRLVAVTKAFDEQAVAAALAAGADGIGENYAQEMVAKAAALDALEAGPERPFSERVAGPERPFSERVPWHFIGQLQRNKVKVLVPLGVALWQTVDRLELAREVARRQPAARVLVQVNTTGEEQKGGCEPGEAPALVAGCQALDLSVAGLMTVGPAGPAEAARPAFRLLRRMADDLGLADCSMGMSADFEVAVDEGATIVRIGSRLFGPRG